MATKRVQWGNLKGFAEWFAATAPKLTDAELTKAIEDKYHVVATQNQLANIRVRWNGQQTKETFLKASASKGVNAQLSAEQLQIAELKKANLHLLKQEATSKVKREELVAAVYQAAMDSASALDLPAVPKPAKIKSGKGKPEVAIAVLSDWQLAKKTVSYSTEVCEKRIEKYAEKVIRLTQIQRAHHPVNELRVYILGDLIEGEMIFEGQAHRIDASLYRQVMLDGPRILGNFLRKMLTVFEKVHVVGVIGNHGAIGGVFRKAYHPESNADAMMYEATRLVLQNEKRLTWAPNYTPGERHWYAVDYIGEQGFLLFHGDQVKGGFGGFPWYGFGKKIMGWRMGAIHEPFKYALAGHFHTPTRMLIGQVTLWVSGSPESDNTFAAEMLAAQGTPSQWLLFCRPDRGITAEFQVHLGSAGVSLKKEAA